MLIEEIRTLSGPNVYHHKPMLVMRLQLQDLSATTTAEHPEFVERLLRLLPGLTEHHCAKGRPGGFVERLMEGTFFGHVVEHVAIELESLNGSAATHGKTRGAGEPGAYFVAVRFASEQGMRYLLRQAVALVEALLRGEAFDLAPVHERYREISADTDLGPSTGAIVEAAARRGIPWRRLDDANLVQLGYGKHRRLVEAAVTDRTSLIAVDLADDKARTKEILHEAGIPVPLGGVAHDLGEALALFRDVGAPVAVKPFDGNKGKGITVGVKNEEELVAAYALAHERSERVIVERAVAGRDYRVLVVAGKMVAASERRPCAVVGDGERTVAQLIEALNDDPLRGEDHELPLTKVKVDEALLARLERAGLSLEHVPAPGEEVVLRSSANLSMGATATDVTDQVHPVTQRLCERAASLIGLDVCGIDLVTSDISQPLDGGILELNASPGLRMHVAPSEGQARDVGGHIVDTLFPPGATGRIPVCAVTGTNGKTTVTRLVGHLMAQTGERVGMTTTDGIHIGGDLVRVGDLTGAASARTVLSDPTVGVAVLETARGGIFRRGLGYDWSDVGVITNITADHLGQDGLETLEDLVWIKSLVAERVRDGGTLVLNADDPGAMQVVGRAWVDVQRLELVLFALEPGTPALAAHLQAGGRGYFVRDGWLIEGRRGYERSIARLADVPLVMGGAARFQVANVLAAAAAARAMGVSFERIANGLATFGGAHNPGRVNLFAHGRGYVLVDYGHNAAAIAATGALLSGWDGPLVGVVGVPGDRSDALVRQAGEDAARAFPRLVLREDEDLRGRRPGEVPELLRAAIGRVAPRAAVEVVPSAREALAGLLDEVAQGALVALFYDHLDEVLELLGAVGAQRVDALPLGAARVAERPLGRGPSPSAPGAWGKAPGAEPGS